MYSMVLMMAMGTPAEAPQGILFNRGGCTGVLGIRAVLTSRPPVRALGCGGSGFLGLRSLPLLRVRTVTTTRVAVAPAAKVGSAGLIQRARVRVHLRAALNRSGEFKLTANQREGVKVALRDNDVFEVAVVKVHRDLSRKLATSPQPAFGDGTLLKLILDNLPAIIDAILRIIAAL